jgi:hypothetical protein
VLAVDAAGEVVWRDTAVAQAPPTSTWGPPLGFGFTGVQRSDDVVAAAREASRIAWRDLVRQAGRGARRR